MPAVSGSTAQATWDVENRLTMIGNQYTGVLASYSYAPGNKRVWRGSTANGTDEITFWSVTGQKMATYSLANGCTQSGINYYFGSKLIKNASAAGWVYSDRLASIGKFYPYGIERSPTTNGTEKFTGYVRDSETATITPNNAICRRGRGGL